jgi:hypothetical protein
MLTATNQLVEGVKKMARKPLSVGAGVVLTTALAVSILFHESTGRAADPVTPLNDNSYRVVHPTDGNQNGM